MQAKVELWPVFFTLEEIAFCKEKFNFSTLDEKSTIFILVSVVKTRGSVWKKKKQNLLLFSIEQKHPISFKHP